MSPGELAELREHLTPAEQAELDALIAADIESVAWRPLPGPQTMAYESLADVIGFGGAAGGGKTDLACGKALTQHRRAAIFRREAPQLVGVLDRLTELLGGRDGYSSRENVWRHAGPRGVNLEFGSVPHAGDERRHQGRPKDLLVIDEATNVLESQARFLMGWVRTTVQGQRTQTLMTFNPPTDSEGRWVIPFFGPWLDRQHPLYGKVRPGQLVWVAAINGRDDWTCPDDPRPFVLKDGARCYTFNPKDYTGARATEVIRPQSRTFIPSRITDNPFLVGTNYMTTLQAMPEPLRSQMLNGDFTAGMEDHEYQVVPTAWVDAAVARWKEQNPKPPMDSLGVDVSRGGRDKTVLQARHGWWFAWPKRLAREDSDDGPKVAGACIATQRDAAVVHIEVNGVGASPYDFLRAANQDVVGVDVGAGTGNTDKSGRLGMANVRSALWWAAREAFDPEANNGIAIPPDPELIADLTAPRWRPHVQNGRTCVLVESRDDIVKRIGRSPDAGTAFVLSLLDTPKRRDTLLRMARANGHVAGEYDPHRVLDGTRGIGASDYDPHAY